MQNRFMRPSYLVVPISKIHEYRVLYSLQMMTWDLFIFARRRREKIANTVLISIGKHVSRTRIVIKFMVHSILYNSIRSRSWDHRLQNLVNVSCIIILRPRWNRTMLFTYWIFTQWSVIVWSIFINNNVLGAEIVFQLSSEAMVLFQNWFKAQRPFWFTPVRQGIFWDQ